MKTGNSFFAKRLNQIKDMGSSFPFPIVVTILLLTLIMEIALTAFAVSIGIFPTQYIALLIVILVAVDIGILALISGGSRRPKQFYTGLILAVLLMIGLLPASYFLNNTGDALQRIVSQGEQWEEYDVVALKDGSYESLDDIKGKTVYAFNSQSKMNMEAKERLVTAADVDFEDEADIISLGNHLLDEQGQTHDELIFLSKSSYEMECEEIEDFEKNTKVIYTLDVMKRSSKSANDIDVTKDAFNIYITGIDAWGSIDNVSRSDVNMIVTVNPQTRQILLTSIPRDAYVTLHSYGQLDKLTHSGIYGVDETLDTVQDWLDLELDYYVKINFSMVVKIINAIGGIRVYSDQEFDSAIAPYHYPKGWVTLHGKSALYFARERKSFKGEDQQRVKNQQKVMQAIINKVTSSKVILTTYPELLSIVSENMTTNLSDNDLAALARMQLKDMETDWTINSISIKCDGAYAGTYSMGMGRELFVNVPREESIAKAQKAIHDVMYPAEVETEGLEDLMQEE